MATRHTCLWSVVVCYANTRDCCAIVSKKVFATAHINPDNLRLKQPPFGLLSAADAVRVPLLCALQPSEFQLKSEVSQQKFEKFWNLEKSLYFCRPNNGNGLMAEWLGRGLQNLVQRFESASDLTATRNGSVFFANSYRWLPPACFSAPPNMATAALSR